MLNDCNYVDTRPGRRCLFSPPEVLEDYAAWLINRYQRSHDDGSALSFGTAQRVNSMLISQRMYGTEVLIFGPHAGAAAEALETVTKGQLMVEVLA